MAIVQDAPDEHAPVLTVTEARQGRRGKHILWVLGISMALVIVGFIALWLVHAPGLSGPGGSTRLTPHEAAPIVQTPQSAPRQTETR